MAAGFAFVVLAFVAAYLFLTLHAGVAEGGLRQRVQGIGRDAAVVKVVEIELALPNGSAPSVRCAIQRLDDKLLDTVAVLNRSDRRLKFEAA